MKAVSPFSKSMFTMAGFVAMVGFLAVQGPATAATSPVVINELIAANGSAVMDMNAKNFSDGLELYNTTAAPIDLTGYTLSDDPATPPASRWPIPAGTTLPAFGYEVIWADGSGTDGRANFSLKQGGEAVVLFDPSGNAVDAVTFGQQVPDISYGRLTDGATEWGYFGQPTLGNANATATAVTDPTQQVGRPDFLPNGGRFNGSVDLVFAPTTAEIRYTTDGTLPQITSTLYTGPVTLNTTTAVRARAFQAGQLPSLVKARTFFINEPTPLPIVSITIDDNYLFDDAIGIHVPGDTYIPGDEWSGNYYQEWQRPMSLEYYEPDGTLGFSLNGGISIHGNSSRQLYRKALSIETDNIYGSNPVQYKIFADRDRVEFPDFILRASGGDYNSTLFRDALASSLVENFLDVDMQGYRPSVLFVNGEYWGVYSIREKNNTATIASYNDVDPNNLDLLSLKDDVLEGDDIAYKALLSYINTHDLADPAYYQYVQSQMDMDEYMNYMIAGIFYSHSRWPKNNIKFWRERTPTGQWRWILFDVDSGFDLREDGEYAHDKIEEVLDPANTWGSFLLRNLMRNPDFKQEFAQRFAANLSITFNPTRVNQIITDMKGVIEPEMPRHIPRWSADPKGLKTFASWLNKIAIMRYFADVRPSYVYTHLQTNLTLGSTTTLTVQIDNPTAGRITIHDVPMPEPSFAGQFFTNLPIQLHATAEPGYRFVAWEVGGTPVSTAVDYTVTINAPYAVTAVFAALPPIVINEIHYNPSDAQGLDATYEFVELYNNSSDTVDLSGYSFQGITYTFPLTASIAAGEYIVVASTAATYSGNGYQVFQSAGGSLNNGGEAITLFNGVGDVVDAVVYDNSTPWAEAPDGQGPSLSLISPSLDNALASSWEPSYVLGGTPGGPHVPPDPAIQTLVINEVLYNPSEVAQMPDATHEFLEIYNPSDSAINLEGFQIADGVVFTFPAGAQIAAHGYVLIAKNAATYATAACPVYQWTSGSLDNAGEAILLVNSGGAELDLVVYGDSAPWPTAADGNGPSLELRVPGLNNALASSWNASVAVGGSPCLINTVSPTAVGLAHMGQQPVSTPAWLWLSVAALLVASAAVLLRPWPLLD